MSLFLLPSIDSTIPIYSSINFFSSFFQICSFPDVNLHATTIDTCWRRCIEQIFFNETVMSLLTSLIWVTCVLSKYVHSHILCCNGVKKFGRSNRPIQFNDSIFPVLRIIWNRSRTDTYEVKDVSNGFLVFCTKTNCKPKFRFY